MFLKKQRRKIKQLSKAVFLLKTHASLPGCIITLYNNYLTEKYYKKKTTNISFSSTYVKQNKMALFLQT